MTLSSKSCHDPVYANASCGESLHLFLLNIPFHDDPNAIQQWISAYASHWPRAGHMVSYIWRHQRLRNVLRHNSWQNRARAVWEVSLLFSHDATADMHHDLPWSFTRSGHLTWPQGKFSSWPVGVKMRMFWFVSTEEYGGVKLLSIFFISNAICKKVDITQKQHFCRTYRGKSQCSLR